MLRRLRRRIGAGCHGPVLVFLLLVMLAACGGKRPVQPELLGEARRLAREGSYWFDRGCLDQARRYFEQALEASRLVDDLEGLVRAENNLAVTALSRGLLDEAAAHLAEALALNRELGSSAEEVQIRSNLGVLAEKAGRAQDAEAFYREAAALSAADAQGDGPAVPLANLGRLQRLAGRPAEAAASLDLARKEAEARDQKGALAGILLETGLLALDGRDLAGAEAAMTEALETDRRLENPMGVAQDLEALGRQGKAAGQLDRAALYWDRAWNLFFTLGLTDDAGRVLERMAELPEAAMPPGRIADYRRLMADPNALRGGPCP